MPGLKVHLLGQFRVAVDGVDIDASRWPRKSARLVLKRLALAPGRKMHREQLIEVLAPDADADAGLNRFHKAIHASRSALEPDLAKVANSRFILTQDTQVMLAGGADVEIDVEQFERQAAAALQSHGMDALQAALALYTGDLLEEDLYEDWTAVHRERLRLIHQRLLGALAANYEAAGDWKTLDVAQRLLAAYPADEEAHRRLMRFYASHGQRHLALEQFKQCADALHQQIDAAPERATVALYESILNGSFAPLVVSPSVAEVPVAPVVLEGPAAPRPRFPRWAFGFAAGLLVAAVAGGFLLRHPEPAAAPPKPLSLAILPLRVGPAGTGLDLVADGLTEALINSTSRLPGLKVMARTTAFYFKGRPDGWQVGAELKVNYIVSGRVDQEEGKLKVNLELVDVADGSRAWARRYSVDRKNLPDIEQLLSTELVAALKVRGGFAAPQVQARRRAGLDADTYQLYLTGRQLGNLRTPAGLRQSIDAYRQAIARDPGYALAYAGLADAYGLLGFRDEPPGEYFPKARDAAAKALELDQSLAEAETSLAMVSALYDWNWVAAETQFRRAIEMNPGYVTAHHWLGVHLAAMGRFDEAKVELEKALALDPRSAIVTLNYGYPDLYRRKYSVAQESAERALVLSPGLAVAHQELSTILALQNKPAAAAAEWIAWLRADGPPELVDRVPAGAGYRAILAESLRWYEGAAARDRKEYVSPMEAAGIAIRLGDTDKAFLWLERAFEQRCPQLVYLAVEPQYDPIRADPRFAALVRRIGLQTIR